MYRGTTPTLIFTLPFEASAISVCSIAFAQYSSRYAKEAEVVLEKSLTDCEAEGSTLKLTLSEEETLGLDDNQDVEIQLRVKCGETAMASEIFRTSVGRILKDGCLT